MTRELHFAVMERFRRGGRVYTRREMRILNKLPPIVRKVTRRLFLALSLCPRGVRASGLARPTVCAADCP